MTNEELAEKIGKGGNDDLLSVLWEQIRKYFEMYSGQYFRRFRDKCDNAGVAYEDLVQECYFAMLKGIKYYNSRSPEQADISFLAYCKYPIRSCFAEMLGYRGHHDPLTDEWLSLNNIVPNGEDENITFIDVIEDPDAEKPFVKIDNDDYYRHACRVIGKLLKECKSYEYEVIKRRYFRSETHKQIADDIGLSPERVRQIEKSALSVLRESYELKQITIYSPFRHVGLENFKHNGSVEEQIVERKELDSWRNKLLESILQKG